MSTPAHDTDNSRLIEYSRQSSIRTGRKWRKQRLSRGVGTIKDQLVHLAEFLFPKNGKEVLPDFRWAQLNGLELKEAHLDDIDGSNAVVSSCKFRGCWLTNTKFLNSTISSCSFIGTYLTGSNFDGSEITKTTFHGLIDGCSFRNSTLVNVDFSVSLSSELVGVDFSGANLVNVDFSGLQLTNCIFQNAILSDVNLANTDLDHADFRDAKIKRVKGISIDNIDLESYAPKYELR